MQRHQIYLRSYVEPHPILYKNSDSYEKSNDILLKNCNGACCFLAGMCFSPPVRGVGDGADSPRDGVACDGNGFSPPVRGVGDGEDRGSGACAEGVGRLCGTDSFEMLFCRARSRGFNPLPANAVLPLSACAHRGERNIWISATPALRLYASRTGGEKYSEFSDSGAVAICRGKQGDGHFSFLRDGTVTVC